MSAQAPGGATVEHTTLPSIAEIDRVVFGDDPYRIPAAEQERIRLSLVSAAVERHIESCAEYAAFARRAGFSASALTAIGDLAHVPQLPTGVFKRATVASMPLDQMAKRCTSSGTRGRLSVVWRDRTTLERLLGSVRLSVGLISQWYEDEVTLLNMGPRTDEAGDLWLAYVMSLLELVYPTKHLIDGGVLDLDRALREVDEALESSTVVGVLGPPALVLGLAERARDRHGVAGGDRLHVITAGGWKRDTDRCVDRSAFAELVGEAFALSRRSQIRDGFNQVELNTAMLECEHLRMHIPPWLEVITRDPYRLSPVPLGEEGLLSYLDPTAESYPGFIASDDIGVVFDDPCPCGRAGRWLKVVRRLERDEQWGCALKMSRAFDAGADGL